MKLHMELIYENFHHIFAPSTKHTQLFFPPLLNGMDLYRNFILFLRFLKYIIHQALQRFFEKSKIGPWLNKIVRIHAFASELGICINPCFHTNEKNTKILYSTTLLSIKCAFWLGHHLQCSLQSMSILHHVILWGDCNGVLVRLITCNTL